MSRASRLQQCVSHLPLVVDKPLIKGVSLSSSELNEIQFAVNTFILDTLSTFFEREFTYVPDVLSTYRDDILSLPNITPNGIFLPKSPTQLSFNRLQQYVARIIQSRVDSRQFAYAHAPITLRIVRDEQDEAVLSRPRASTKPHTDIWAAEPSASCMCFIPVAGDFAANGVSFYNNDTLPSQWREPLDDYCDGATYVAKEQKLDDVAMQIGELYFVDSHVIHQTEKGSPTLRATLDFRFLYTEWEESDNAESLHRMENYLPLKEWFDVGIESVLKFNQPLAEFKDSDATTNGYSTPYEYHRLVGCTDKSIDRYVLAHWLGCNLQTAEEAIQLSGVPSLPTYQQISTQEQQQLLAKADKQLHQDMRVCSRESRGVWELGWGEVRDRMHNSGTASEVLKPQYSNYQYFRLFDEYVRSNDSMFEEHTYSMLRAALFNAHFQETSTIVEFGSGTGTSLLLLDKCIENAVIHTCDWAEASNDICRSLAVDCRNEVHVHNVDLFTMKGAEPLQSLSQSTVFSFHTFEQLGDDFDSALAFLLAMKPSKIVQLEPFDEVYDDSNVFDLVAKEYHYKRNYLSGYVNRLKELEAEGRVHIQTLQRLSFGSMFHEGYNLLIWKTL